MPTISLQQAADALAKAGVAPADLEMTLQGGHVADVDWLTAVGRGVIEFNRFEAQVNSLLIHVLVGQQMELVKPMAFEARTKFLIASMNRHYFKNEQIGSVQKIIDKINALGTMRNVLAHGNLVASIVVKGGNVSPKDTAMEGARKAKPLKLNLKSVQKFASDCETLRKELSAAWEALQPSVRAQGIHNMAKYRELEEIGVEGVIAAQQERGPS